MEPIQTLIDTCIGEGTGDPVGNFLKLTSLDGVPMHGPIHHCVVPMALLTAIWNVRKDFDLVRALEEAVERMSPVPGAICGRLGCCGAAVSTGAVCSILRGTTPLTEGEDWSMGLSMTASALTEISSKAGPRCCKRNSVLAIQTACRRSEEVFGVRLECSDYVCDRVGDNSACIGRDCPFFP